MVIQAAVAAAAAGRTEEACELGERGIADGCDPAPLHAMIGAFRCRDQDFARALPHLTAAHDLRPADPLILRNFATALVGFGRYGDALAAVSAGETDPNLLRLRAYAAHMEGDLAEATETYERVLAMHPLDWESWNNLGNCRVDAGNIREGVEALRRATVLRPQSGQVRMNLARALRAAGEIAEAEAILRALAAERPGDERPLIELSDLLHRERGDDPGAVDALEEAVHRAPPSADLLARLGRQYLLTFSVDQAIETFERALAHQRDHGDAFLGLAEAHEIRSPEALPALVERAMKAQIQGPPAGMLMALAATRTRRFEEGLRALSDVPEEFEPHRRWQLEGQLRDGAGDYDGAFAAFERMNAAHLSDASDPAGRATTLRGRLHEKLRTTTGAWRDSWAPAPDPPERPPIFLLGFPRSGTTLLDTMLMGHPQVRVMEERPVLARLEAELGGFDAIARLGTSQIEGARNRYFEIASEYTVCVRGETLVDKSPLHLQRLPLIARLFPNASIILALRHPADVVLSCFMANFRLNPSMANFLTLETAAEFYDLSFRMWENARSLFPVDVHHVRYEELIADPEATLRPVIEGVGLAWDDALLRHQQTGKQRGVITTASYAQVTQPLYTSAAGRWRHYRRHLEPVLPVLAHWAAKFGYDL